MRIGVFLPNWIGDAVMATPALRALRQHFTSAHLIGICRPAVAQLLGNDAWLDEFLLYDRHAQSAPLGMRQAIQQLRRRHVDQAVLLTNSFSSAWIAWMGRARRRAGYARYGRGCLLTEKLSAPTTAGKRPAVSAVDYYLQLVRHLGCPVGSRQLELQTQPEDEAAADHVWNGWPPVPSQPVVILNPGSAYGPAKNWPLEHFADLARRLVADFQAAVLVICGPQQQQDATQIVALADNPHVTSLAGVPLSPGLSKACIRRSTLVITTDSGPRHIAAAFGIPTLTLFGPTDPSWSYNYHPDDQALSLNLACQPCGKRRCPVGHHDCMRQLNVERVMQEAAKWFHAGQSTSIALTTCQPSATARTAS